MWMLMALVLLSGTVVEGTTVPFTRGINLTQWLQAPGVRQVQFSRFTREDLVDIQSLGIDVIRLPVNLPGMTGPDPDFTVDPLLFFFLDQIVDWTGELGLQLILENHPASQASTAADVDRFLLPVWQQIARHYAGSAPHLLFEILNEPHGIEDTSWHEIQQAAVTAVRAIDAARVIVIAPGNWSSYRNLRLMPTYEDEHLIYTFHFYDPFVFTHQGATWTTLSMLSLAGVPFPFDAARMPAVPTALSGSWVEGALTAYRTQGRAADVEALLDIAADFARERDVPIFCGEIGVHIPNSDPRDRVFWYETVRSHLERQDIPWVMWDYQGGFGLFEAGTGEQFDFDLNEPLLAALGLRLPPQAEFVQRPDTQAFSLYSDVIETGIVENSWISAGELDFYSESAAVSGRFGISLTDIDRYNAVTFDFRPDRDLSQLVRAGFALEFRVRGNTPGTAVDVRFLDGHHAERGDLPWRMRVTVDESLTDVTWDDSWQLVQIPLSSFHEHGAWDGDFHEPQGVFDWTDVDRFEIVAEHHDLLGNRLAFDDIRIVSVPATVVATTAGVPTLARLSENYPNPFNGATVIPFDLDRTTTVDMAIFDALGRRLRTLVDGTVAAGTHRAHWDGLNDAGTAVASGTYFYRLQSAGRTVSHPMTLLR